MKISQTTIRNLLLGTAVLLAFVIMLYPSCETIYNASQRAERQNKVHELAKAILKYESMRRHLPFQAITDPNGTTLLSWRVALLPVIGERSLYEEFHLDEAWDSPHNLPLLNRMPDAYRAPIQDEDATNTHYQVPSGKGTMFDPMRREPMTSNHVTNGDGTSNTILLVEAAHPVPWTKPEDVVVDEGPLMAKLGGELIVVQKIGLQRKILSETFNIAMADGSVRTLTTDTPEADLRRAMLYNDGSWDPLD